MEDEQQRNLIRFVNSQHFLRTSWDGFANAHEQVAKTAPNIAPHVSTMAMNAIQYLNSKLPFAGNELPMDAHHEPSRAVKSQWLGLHEAINNPLSVLDHVKNGTISPHHVEAVSAVFPDLHQEMIGKINEEIGSMKAKGEKVPYKTQMSLTKLIGSPLNSTMTPQNMQAIMHSAMPQQMAQQVQKAGGGKASGAELSQVNKVNKIYATKSQAEVMNRK